MEVLGVFDPIALQGTEVIPVAQIGHQLFENCPIAVAARRSELAFEMALEIGLDVIVVEQSVVDIDEEHGLVRGYHYSTFSAWRVSFHNRIIGSAKLCS